MNAKDTLLLKKFPVTIHTDCKNICRIYPLKQRQVSDIYQAAKAFPEIKRILIFGSSVTPRCRIDSDLDICIDETSGDGKKIFDMQKAMGDISGWNCDIVMFGNLGEKMKETVVKEGVVIYE